MIFWLIIFLVALIALVKGADWLLKSGEKIGFALGLSPFIIGVVIIGIGTSLPELASSLMGVLQGADDIPVANAIGSNIANILLIGGSAAIIGRKIIITKNIIDLDIPMISITTILLILVAYDGKIILPESIILLIGFAIYLTYSLLHKENLTKTEKKSERPKITGKDILLLIFGFAALAIGAKYVIDAVIHLSSLLKLAPALIAGSALAVGTSLPELIVSIKATMNRKGDIAIGNIFGSNVFNLLVVIGIPGLLGTLTVDESVLKLSLPVLLLATFLFVISALSKKIYIWEGLMYILIYILFLAKFFAVF